MSRASDQLNEIKLFGMTCQLVEHELDRVERELAIDLGRSRALLTKADEDFYPQIEAEYRAEAAAMAPNYETLYSLEKTIRRLITDALAASPHGDDWWNTAVPEAVRLAAEALRKRDLEGGTTPRSDEMLDYCTFGELGEVIKANWDVFGGMFTTVKAVQNVMFRLNTLRGPIAHCSALSEDEALRLRLTVRDWFRLME
jgi:hypothetical protein